MLKKQILAGGLATIALVTGGTQVASPVSAAQDGATAAGGNPGAWIMPDVRNTILQRAINSVLDVTGDVDLDLRIQNRKNTQDVINYTNWEVCSQSPRAGSEISQKTMRVVLAVRRPGTKGCG